MALLVLIVPGALVLGSGNLARRIPPLLIPASALALSLVVIGVICAVTLWASQPIRTSAVLLAGFLCIAAAVWIVRCVVSVVRGTERGASILLRMLTAAVSWMRRAPRGVIAIAAVAAGAALLSGERFYGDGDSYFHAAIALKLQTLAAPTFSNIGQYLGGDGHPGYALPVWHEAIALIARLSHQPVIETMRLMPVLLAPVSVLTVAGVAQIAFRSAAASTAAAAAYVGGRILFTFPAMDGIVNASEPRTVASGILLPLVVALVLVVVGRVRAADVGMHCSDPAAADPWVPSVVVAACATVALTYTHVSYVVWLAMVLMGIAIVSLPRGWHEPQLRRAQLAVGVSVLVAALVPVITLQRAIGRLQDDPQGGFIGGLPLAGADVHRVLVGHGHWLHLRADYIIWFGAVAFVGLLGVVWLTRWLRDPLVAWIPVVGVIAGVSVLVPPVFRLLAHAIGVAQTSRVYLIVPWVFGVAALVVLVGGYLERLWGRGLRGRLCASGLYLAVLGGMVGFVQLWPALPRRSAPPVMPAWPVAVLIGICAAGCGIAAYLGRSQSTWLRPAAAWQQRGVGIFAATLIVTIAPMPMLITKHDRVQQVIDTGPTSGIAVPGAGEVGVRTRRALGGVMRSRPHPVVLAEPHLAYRILALVPAYAAAVPPGHAAITARNRPYDREHAVLQFLRPGTSSADRMRILQRERVDVVVLRRRVEQDAIRFALAHPAQLVLVGESPKLQTFRVQH